MSTNGTNVNVPLFSSGAMFTPPEVSTVTENTPPASSMKYEPPSSEDATNNAPADVNSVESAENSEDTEEGQLGGSASAALAALPVETDHFWRQALLDAVADLRVEKAYNDAFAPAASGASGALPELPRDNPFFGLTQTVPPGISAEMLALIGFRMPTNLAASAAAPVLLTRALNPTVYDMIAANPNPAIWETLLKSLNPPLLYPTDLPLASGAMAPLTGKDKWKADNRNRFVILAPTDDQMILRDGMTGEQTAAVIFNFNLRQYIDPKARALGAAERASPLNFNRVAWATINIPATDLVIFDNDNSGLYTRVAANVTTLDILKRIVLMEARILHGFGAAPTTAPAPAVVTPGAPAPVAPVVPQQIGIPNMSAMSAPIMAAIQGITATNSPLMVLVNKVGSAVNKVGKQVTSTASSISELSTGVQTIAQGLSSGNAEGGGRKSRRIRRA